MWREDLLLCLECSPIGKGLIHHNYTDPITASKRLQPQETIHWLSTRNIMGRWGHRSNHASFRGGGVLSWHSPSSRVLSIRPSMVLDLLRASYIFIMHCSFVRETPYCRLRASPERRNVRVTVLSISICRIICFYEGSNAYVAKYAPHIQSSLYTTYQD